MIKREQPTDEWSTPEMIALRDRLGWAGMGRYRVLLDIIAHSMSPGDPPQLELHRSIWWTYLGLKSKTFELMLRTFRDLKLISVKRSGNILRITALKLSDQLDVTHRRARAGAHDRARHDATRIPGSSGSRFKDPAVRSARARVTRLFNQNRGWGKDQVVELAEQLPEDIGDFETRGTLLLVALRKELEEPSDDPRSRTAERYFVGLIGTRLYTIPDTDRQRFKELAYGASRSRAPEAASQQTAGADSSPWASALAGLTSSHAPAAAPPDRQQPAYGG